MKRKDKPEHMISNSFYYDTTISILFLNELNLYTVHLTAVVFSVQKSSDSQVLN